MSKICFIIRFSKIATNGLAMRSAGLKSTSLSASCYVCYYSFTFNLAPIPALRIAVVVCRIFFNVLI